jgi:TrmH family RNA methyltransferase
MITSTKNDTVKQLKSLQSRARERREAGAFVVEGVRLAEEALSAGWPVRLCLYDTDLNQRGQAVVAALRQASVETIPAAPHVIAAISDTQTPQGILLTLDYAALPLPEKAEFVLVLDRLGDPGNAGTLLRTAAATGMDAVLFSTGSVDPFSPKVLRSGMGAHFRLPVHTLPEDEIVSICHARSLRMLLAEAGKGDVYTAADLRSPLALAVGSEAHGPGEVFQSAADGYVHIPMPGESESLNAAVAASVLVFEALRQRSN